MYNFFKMLLNIKIIFLAQPRKDALNQETVQMRNMPEILRVQVPLQTSQTITPRNPRPYMSDLRQDIQDQTRPQPPPPTTHQRPTIHL